MVQTELKLDPHSGITVIFRSKRGDRLKILVWDGTGLVLTYKILENGSFAWPKVQDGTMCLSRAQYEALFEGLDWRRVMAQRVTRFCRKFFGMLNAALFLDAIMLKAPQRPQMENDCHLRMGASGSYAQLRCPQSLLRLNEKL